MAGRRSCAAIYLGLSLMFGMHAQAQDSKNASVAVTIKVPHFGNVAFPAGTGFRIYVPTAAETRGRPFAFGRPPHVSLAVVPFVVSGNTLVSLHVEPEALLTSKNGSQFGSALAIDNSGEILPYVVVLEFPLGTPTRPLNGIGAGGRNVTAKATLTADASNGPLSGQIHIVPGITRGDISSGRSQPGWYDGNLRINVTSGN